MINLIKIIKFYENYSHKRLNKFLKCLIKLWFKKLVNID